MILITYYFQTAKTQALYASIDEPAGRSADNPPNSDMLGDFHQTVPELRFRFIHHPECPCGNSSVWTQTQTWSDGLEPLLTLSVYLVVFQLSSVERCNWFVARIIIFWRLRVYVDSSLGMFIPALWVQLDFFVVKWSVVVHSSISGRVTSLF